MTSWIMQLWLQNHDESEWPDLSIRQTDDASHVLDEDHQHPSIQNIKKMCSEEFFAKHTYRYVQEADNNCNGSCPSGGSYEEDGSLYTSAYSSRIVRKNKALLPSNEDASGHSCPAEMTTTKSDNNTLQTCHSNKMDFLNNARIDTGGVKRRQNEICQARHSSETEYVAVCSSESNVEYQNVDYDDSFREQDDCATYDKPVNYILQDGTRFSKCQNVTQKMKQSDCSIYDKQAANMTLDMRNDGENQNKVPKMDVDDCVPEDREKSGVYQNVTHNVEQKENFMYNKPAPKDPEDKEKDRAYENMAQNDGFVYDTPAAYIPVDGEKEREYENIPYIVEQNDRSMYDTPVANVPEKRRMAHNTEQNNCSTNSKLAANVPEYIEGDAEYLNMEALRQAQDDRSMDEDKGQTTPFSGLITERTRNAPGFKAKRQFKWQPKNKRHINENMMLMFSLIPQRVIFEELF